MPMGPRPILLFLDATLNVSPHDLLSLLSLNIAHHLDASKLVFLFDMTNTFCLGSLSAPPRPQPSTSFTITIDGPLPESFFEAPAPVPQPLPPPLPQPVVVDQAAQEEFDDTLEYWIEEADPEIASNAIITIDAATQYSRPSSRPGLAAASPRPIIGLCISGAIEAIITGAAPVYAPRQPRPPALAPSPPPLY